MPVYKGFHQPTGQVRFFIGVTPSKADRTKYLPLLEFKDPTSLMEGMQTFEKLITFKSGNVQYERIVLPEYTGFREIDIQDVPVMFKMKIT